jgi:hypothetical protein
MDGLDRVKFYEIFNLSKNATLEDLEQSYLKLVGKKLREGSKDELESLKQIYAQLRDYIQQEREQQQEAQKQAYQHYLTELINNNLRSYNLKVKVNFQENHLEILVNARQAKSSKRAKNLLEYVLQQINLPSIESAKVIGIKADQSRIWEKELRIYRDANKVQNIAQRSESLLEEAERNTNTFALPIAFLIAFTVSFVEPLAWFIGMWVHEFGHATMAWFSSYRAMVTFAGTITQLQQSNFVYFGILFLLGLLFYYGWKEQKKVTMIIAIILAVIQFILTWIISPSTYQMLMTFAGVGGEFYLSTLLIIGFYVKLPEKFYWDFWRYFALIIGSITFWSSFGKWHNIRVGKDQVPWGTFWGGRGDSGGDMNILNQEYNWTIQQIIDTYNHLGNICLLVIMGFYLYFLMQSRPILWFKIKQKLSKFFLFGSV